MIFFQGFDLRCANRKRKIDDEQDASVYGACLVVGANDARGNVGHVLNEVAPRLI